MVIWRSGIERVLYPDAGAFESGFKPRLVWHTTEGSSLPIYSRGAPHFTIHPRTGKTWQHIRLDQAATALEGSDVAGIATNRAHAIQVEIIGAAADSDNWPDSYYDNIRELGAWIEENCDVAPVESVTFTSNWHGMSHQEWRDYEGHCGHQHVPGQHHWDPGRFKVEKVIGGGSAVRRTLTYGDRGGDVSELQRAVNDRADGCCRPDRRVTVDGCYGRETRSNSAWAAYILGIGDTQDELITNGLSTYTQERLRNPALRNEIQRDRAAGRRAQYCNCTH